MWALNEVMFWLAELSSSVRSRSGHSCYIWCDNSSLSRQISKEETDISHNMVVRRWRSLPLDRVQINSHIRSYSFLTTSLHPTAGFVSCVNQRHLLVNYVHDVKDILQVYELATGQLVRDLPLDVGTVAGVSCKKKHSEFFYKFTSFTTPGNSVIAYFTF